MNEELVENYFALLMEKGLGLDLSDENLAGTPQRVAKMFCREFFCNMGKDFTDYKCFPNSHQYSQIIISEKIFFTSYCSHHFLPFTGNAWILYIPKTKLVGASKPARSVEHYAQRPQLQENLCHEVLNSFVKHVEPHGAMVFIRAIHGCMKCRGVRQQAGGGMGTSAIWGAFKSDKTLELKGYELIKISMMDDKI